MAEKNKKKGVRKVKPSRKRIREKSRRAKLREDNPHKWMQELGAFEDNNRIFAVMDRTKLGIPKRPRAVIRTNIYYLRKALKVFESILDSDNPEYETVCIQFMGVKYPYMLAQEPDDTVGIVVAPRKATRKERDW